MQFSTKCSFCPLHVHFMHYLAIPLQLLGGLWHLQLLRSPSRCPIVFDDPPGLQMWPHGHTYLYSMSVSSIRFSHMASQGLTLHSWDSHVMHFNPFKKKRLNFHVGYVKKTRVISHPFFSMSWSTTVGTDDDRFFSKNQPSDSWNEAIFPLKTHCRTAEEITSQSNGLIPKPQNLTGIVSLKQLDFIKTGISNHYAKCRDWLHSHENNILATWVTTLKPHIWHKLVFRFLDVTNVGHLLSELPFPNQHALVNVNLGLSSSYRI